MHQVNILADVREWVSSRCLAQVIAHGERAHQVIALRISNLAT